VFIDPGQRIVDKRSAGPQIPRWSC